MAALVVAMGALTGILVGGAATGCVYALLAAAYTLVFKASHTVPLMSGAFLLLGGYGAFALLGLGLLRRRRT